MNGGARSGALSLSQIIAFLTLQSSFDCQPFFFAG